MNPRINESEVKQYMSTGMSRSEAIEEIIFWRNVSAMLGGTK